MFMHGDLTQLYASGFLPEVWIPDEPTQALRRQVTRRNQIVRQRSRLKNITFSVFLDRDFVFGGGGSFNSGTDAENVAGIRAGNGEIDITEFFGGAPAGPEPSTWAMMATGFAALGLAGLRRRRRKA